MRIINNKITKRWQQHSKYVERQAEDNINWSQVGKEFSDMLGNRG